MKQNPSSVCGEGAAASTGAAGGAAASGEGAAASTGAASGAAASGEGAAASTGAAGGAAEGAAASTGAAGALAFSVGTLPRRQSNWSAWQRWLHDGVAKRMGIPVYP